MTHLQDLLTGTLPPNIMLDLHMSKGFCDTGFYMYPTTTLNYH